LRCLEAELRYREQRLRDAGVSDLKEYLTEGHPEPLPRLVVIIDEFATMVAELPDFIDSLVGIAQRGRSLGVHMILATQRPGGAVNNNIRANTNLRISLRVQDVAESVDVLNSPPAAPLAVPVGLADDPDRQRQIPFFFDPAAGNLLLYGVSGAGTTTALATLALVLAEAHPVERLHLYVLDFGTQALAPLADLPHVGA